MSGTSGWAVAVDVGGTSIKGARVDTDGRLADVRRLLVADVAAGRLVDAVLDMVDDLIAAETARPIGIGLAVPGIVDEARRVAVSSMMLGWQNVPFGELLSRRDRPVAFLHDVTAGAYAERCRGSAFGHRHWLFLALGTGLGTTFVLDDRPYRGGAGRGGELAHVVVRPDGPLCRCGKRGCAEMLASAESVLNAYNHAAPSPASSAAEVAARVRADDPTARRVWTEAVEALVDVVAGYVESMNPTAVVVGGGLADSGPLLLEPFITGLRDRIAYADPHPVVRPATFGADAGLVGAGLAAHAAAAGSRPWSATGPIN